MYQALDLLESASHLYPMLDTRPEWLKLYRVSMLQAVRQAMAFNGGSWIYCWTLQSRTSWRWLHREARILQDRIDAIDAGALVTEAELIALCRAWDAPVEEVRLTMV